MSAMAVAYAAAVALASAVMARRSTRRSRFTKKCKGCWMLTGHCICSELATKARLPHRTLVYLSHVEAKKQLASNSAKLIWMGIENSDVFFAGDADDERRLDAILEQDRGRVFVMYPTKDAVLPREARERVLAQPRRGLRTRDSVTVIVVDATWRPARRMAQRFEGKAPFVKLGEVAERRHPAMRKIRVTDRMTSMTALQMFLEQYGGCDAEELERLEALHWVLLDAYFAQNPHAALSPLKGASSLDVYRVIRDGGSAPRTKDRKARKLRRPNHGKVAGTGQDQAPGHARAVEGEGEDRVDL